MKKTTIVLSLFLCALSGCGNENSSNADKKQASEAKTKESNPYIGDWACNDGLGFIISKNDSTYFIKAYKDNESKIFEGKKINDGSIAFFEREQPIHITYRKEENKIIFSNPDNFELETCVAK